MDVQDRLQTGPEQKRNPERSAAQWFSMLRWLVVALVGLGLLLFPLVADQYSLSLAYTLFVSIALAQSWNLVGGYTGLVSLGQAAFFGLGAYTTALLLTNLGVPFVLAVLAS